MLSPLMYIAKRNENPSWSSGLRLGSPSLRRAVQVVCFPLTKKNETPWSTQAGCQRAAFIVSSNPGQGRGMRRGVAGDGAVRSLYKAPSSAMAGQPVWSANISSSRLVKRGEASSSTMLYGHFRAG